MSKPDERIEAAVLDVLKKHRGKRRRLSRGNLRGLVVGRVHQRVSDRAMRNAIEQLRTNHRTGALICSTTQGGGGYWLAENLGELDRYLRQDESRLREIAKRLRAQRKAAGLKFNTDLEQMEMFG